MQMFMVGIKDFLKVVNSRGYIMRKNREHSKIFIVVKVHSGIPVVADAFIDESAAEQRAKELKVDINPEYDEVEIFQTALQ